MIFNTMDEVENDQGEICWRRNSAFKLRVCLSLSLLFVTIPAVFLYRDMCRLVHENGGQVYLDGANMNAQVC